jgi:hypothetical protein
MKNSSGNPSSVVVVPIYREFLSDNERHSLNQCFRVFSSRPIMFVAPKGLATSTYESIAGSKPVEFVFFPRRFFRSIESYSLLLMSRRFYRRFTPFDYLLVYQLDAYAFRDDLDVWCEKGFDYIGAPWIDSSSTGGISPTGVGNGGFSLRRVRAFLDFGEGRYPAAFSFKELAKLHYQGQFAHGTAMGKLAALIKLAFKATGFRNNLRHYARQYTEDDFWCGIVPKTGVALRIAPFDEALQFSFENCPECLFLKNGKRLPFGCHAWHRYSPEFWRPFIFGEPDLLESNASNSSSIESMNPCGILTVVPGG